VLAALRLDTRKLAAPHADGDREALRILLAARHELTTAATGRGNRLLPCYWPTAIPTARPRARH
jgi:hypothetical protein